MNGRKIKLVYYDEASTMPINKKMDRLYSKWIIKSLWNLDKIKQPKFKVRVIHPLDKKEEV